MSEWNALLDYADDCGCYVGTTFRRNNAREHLPLSRYGVLYHQYISHYYKIFQKVDR